MNVQMIPIAWQVSMSRSYWTLLLLGASVFHIHICSTRDITRQYYYIRTPVSMNISVLRDFVLHFTICNDGPLNPGVGNHPVISLMHTWVRWTGLRNLHRKRCENCERHERREETGEKTKFSSLYILAPGFNNSCHVSLFPVQDRTIYLPSLKLLGQSALE